ncbi:hypothetical protein CASFOL_002792 [Castilleja foliolosa]|uniref:Uncharacterized protein n=1 Tax=Castilleja foliolosa TaxID=1961234 RepID=A0ABD3EIR7_9LAMI
MPPIPPPQPPSAPPLTPHHRHHHFLKKPTSLPDAIFTALSLLVLFSTYPKSPSLFSPRKFPKMSSPSQTLENPAGGPVPAVRHAAVPTRLAQAAPRRRYIRRVRPGTKNVHNLWLEVVEGKTVLTDSLYGGGRDRANNKKRRHKKTPHRIAPGAVKRRR